MRHSGKESLLGRCYKSIPGVDDGLGDRTLQRAENTHFLVQIRILEFMQQFQDKLLLDQFFKFLSYNF